MSRGEETPGRVNSLQILLFIFLDWNWESRSSSLSHNKSVSSLAIQVRPYNIHKKNAKLILRNRCKRLNLILALLNYILTVMSIP